MSKMGILCTVKPSKPMVSSALRARLGHFPTKNAPLSHLSGNEWDIEK